ncbi:cation diffusion facilitator family transporter [Parachitinimonas caeni]|uniref:Cation diffusion facilitator family transporter n=1 Tax=Parachitinimonas caeni TaxID=3031301 RepID=A0ABT7E2W0_9NEIS|nr:cation diffusion facilitator family transporter [Parachitinimonas caeni]MDK2126649.1 cation diffusion facilitator family transporter [Parachitinimonas caeni]
MSAQADSLKSIFFALGANFAIGVSKLGAALYTGSGSMLAEAVHSFADCGNQALLIWGLKAAKTPPSPDFPLGYGKAIYFWSFIVALMLFSLGGLFSIYEGVHKLQDPEQMEAPWLAIGVLAFGVVAESISLWGAMREINKLRGGKGLLRWAQETRQSELVVILGEDVAALAGLAVALAAVCMATITDNPMWDALGGIVIGVLLIGVALFIGVEIKALLIGQSVEPEVRSAMRAHLEADSAIEKVFNIITLQLGNDVMVAVKAKVKAETAAEQVTEINRIEAALKAAFPQIKWSFFEPDIAD